MYIVLCLRYLTTSHHQMYNVVLLLDPNCNLLVYERHSSISYSSFIYDSTSHYNLSFYNEF
jgi:hypothetical protein